MRFQLFAPCTQLAPYVKHLVISETTEERTYNVLPDTALVMGFQYQGRLAYLNNTLEVPLTMSGITGIQNGFRIFRSSPSVGSVLVIFTETGAASFFREPVHELFNESLSLDHFVRRSVLDSLEDQLSLATTDWARITLVEGFLLSQLRDDQIDPLISQALQYIHQSNGTIRMTALMDKLCISQSPLEKRFRKQVGTSPKKFASIVRMNHAIRLISSANQLTQVGLEAGFFDQAHFVHEFKIFTGLSPTEFLQTSAPV